MIFKCCTRRRAGYRLQQNQSLLQGGRHARDGHRGDRRVGGRGAGGRWRVHQGDARGYRRTAVRGAGAGGGAGSHRARRRLAGGLRRRPQCAAQRGARRRVAAGAPVGRGRPRARRDARGIAGAWRHQRPLRQPPDRAREPPGVRDEHPPARRGRRADRGGDRDGVQGRDVADRSLRARPVGDEDNWRLFPLRGAHAGRRTYGERLQDELSFTPVALRYNTGLRISQNGRGLARLLDDLVAGWPVAVEEIILVGHSMGGVVVRSACHYGEQDGRRWTNEVRHVFSLGSPHLGADLEKGVNILSWGFGRLPETRALAAFLNARSVGIKDLRYGACVDEDWCDCEDPDEFLRDRCTEVPFLADAHYYFIGAPLMDGPVGAALGDLLVRIPSASGRGHGKGRRIPFDVDKGHELTGLTHMDLLNHPAVYQQMRDWITSAPTDRSAVTA